MQFFVGQDKILVNLKTHVISKLKIQFFAYSGVTITAVWTLKRSVKMSIFMMSWNPLLKSASDILGLSDPSTIELDDDSLLFEDYEEGDDDEDYSEVTYDYEYEDDEEDDDDEDDDDYYEEKTIVKTVVAKPKRPAVVAPPPRPAYNNNYQPRRPPLAANRRPQYAATGAAGYAGAYGARRRPHTPPPSSSGAQFLGQVEGLFGEAEHSLDQGLSPHITLTGSLREALLR